MVDDLEMFSAGGRSVGSLPCKCHWTSASVRDPQSQGAGLIPPNDFPSTQVPVGNSDIQNPFSLEAAMYKCKQPVVISQENLSTSSSSSSSSEIVEAG